MAFSLAIFIEEIFPFSHGHRHQKSGQNKHLEGPTPFTCQFNSHYEKTCTSGAEILWIGLKNSTTLSQKCCLNWFISKWQKSCHRWQN